jgi:predicted NBD/HSP70 family sugar kinase
MKTSNLRLVFDLIREEGSVSRKDIAKKTGLTSPSVTNLVGELLEKKYIVESGFEESSGGRKAVSLSLNPSKMYIIGVNLMPDKIDLVITDFKAEIIQKVRLKLDNEASPETIIDKIADSIIAIIESTGLLKEQVFGIGLVTPGPCDIEKGLVINPPNLTGWHNITLKKIIEEIVDIPVAFEKETAASALYEYWFGQAKESKVLLACGVYHTGIGASVMIDGKVFHGFRNSAGEIGHMCVDTNGPKCACGNYGCLETYADGRALLRRVRAILKNDVNLCKLYGINDVDALTLEEVLALAEKGENIFAEQLLICAQYVAVAIGNVIVNIGPDTIVLTGDIPNNSPRFIEIIERYIQARPYPGHNTDISIYSSELKQNVETLGGVALVYERIFKTDPDHSMQIK